MALMAGLLDIADTEWGTEDNRMDNRMLPPLDTTSSLVKLKNTNDFPCEIFLLPFLKL